MIQRRIDERNRLLVQPGCTAELIKFSVVQGDLETICAGNRKATVLDGVLLAREVRCQVGHVRLRN